MNILIAPNSFKNSLSAFQIATLIEKAFLSVNEGFSINKQPMADGGDGTLKILSGLKEGNYHSLNVKNPIGNNIKASYYLTTDKTAIIELAEASGIKLLKEEELNPCNTSTFGTGELIIDAIKNGAKKIIIGVGGSATIDLGIGAALALGVKFIDTNGKTLNKIDEILICTNSISLDKINWMNPIGFEILCDVKNPIFGDTGGIKVYGPQKGASAEFIQKREKSIERFINVLGSVFNFKFENEEYYGASGGFPLIFNALFNAKIYNGAEYIMKVLDLEEKVKLADIIITTEGKFDVQSLEGKVPVAVANLAKKHQKPVILITGQTDFWDNSYFDGIFPIVSQPDNLENLLLNSEKLLFSTSRQLALLISKMSAKNG